MGMQHIKCRPSHKSNYPVSSSTDQIYLPISIMELNLSVPFYYQVKGIPRRNKKNIVCILCHFIYMESSLLFNFVQSYRMVIFMATNVIWKSSTCVKRYTKLSAFKNGDSISRLSYYMSLYFTR